MLNHTYRVIFNTSTQCYVAVSELCKSKGKTKSVVQTCARATSTTKCQPSAYSTRLSAPVPFKLKLLLAVISSVIASSVLITPANAASCTDNTINEEELKCGKGSIASGQNSAAYGYNSSANGQYSAAYGYNSSADGQSSTAIGPSSNASGAASTAIGVKAEAAVGGSTAIGNSATATGGGTAVGVISKASGISSSAYGRLSEASGSNSSAYGINSLAAGNDSAAFGNASKASGSYSSAYGANSEASGSISSAYGSNSKSTSLLSSAYGANSEASGDISSAYGAYSKATEYSSSAYGAYSEATAYRSSAYGTNSKAIAYASSAYGAESVVASHYGSAFGSDSSVDRNSVSGVAIGVESNVQDSIAGVAIGSNVNTIDGAHGAVALGGGRDEITMIFIPKEGAVERADFTAINTRTKVLENGRVYKDGFDVNGMPIKVYQYADTDYESLGLGAKATGLYSVALGNGSLASVRDGVALGSKSRTTVDSGVAGYDPATKADSTNTSPTWQATHAAVSVGDTSDADPVNWKTRQITGVAAGTTDTDAVNVAQLKKVQTTANTVAGAVMYDDANLKDNVTFGSVGTPVSLGNVANATSNLDAINFGQLQGVATVLGGGASFNNAGVFQAPTYTINKQNFNDVGSAFTAVDGRLTSLEGQIGGGVGAKGDSAYQVAVSNGFNGTQAEWLTSLKGEKGDKGDKGDTGAQGPAGTQGPVGPQGVKGDKGDTGAQGPAGPQGPAGAGGAGGGAQGPAGPQGPQGPQGVKGDQGPAGPQGPKGEKGDMGAQGPAGQDGKDGVDGAQGPAGPQGPKGDKGDMGVQGLAGQDGKDGVDGLDGAQGPKGDKGDQGIQGPAGQDGIDGKDGVDGAQGPKGDKGDVGMTDAEKAQITDQITANSENNPHFLSIQSTNAATKANYNNSGATGKQSMAVGEGATSSGDKGVAFGSNASATHNNSVAIGADSQTEAVNTVSMGNATTKRRVTNVAAGINPHDAVNKSQLDTVRSDAMGYTDRRINQMDERTNSAIAGSLAFGAIKAPISPGKVSMGLGAGTWEGQQGFAIGVGYTAPNGSYSINGAFGGSNDQKGGNIGLSFTFD